MKVLIVSAGHPSSIGGVERVVSHIAERLESLSSIEYTIVCAKESPDSDSSSNVDTLSVSGIGPTFDLQFGKNFRDYLRGTERTWDLIHFHLPQARGPAMFLPRSYRESCVLTVHVTSYGMKTNVYDNVSSSRLVLKDKVYKHLYSRFLPRMEELAISGEYSITTVSNGVKREVQSYYGANVNRVIPNGINTGSLSSESLSGGKRAEDDYLLFVGRMTPQKGVFRIPDVLDHVDRDVTVKLVGGGRYRTRAKRFFEKRKINADFLGTVTDEELWNLYKNATLLLLPSYYEGHPMVALEGACAGLPIVAFEASNVRSTVCEKNQQLISSNGDLEGMADSISILYENPTEATRIGEGNREQILDHYFAGRMADDYVRLYRSLQ